METKEITFDTIKVRPEYKYQNSAKWFITDMQEAIAEGHLYPYNRLYLMQAALINDKDMFDTYIENYDASGIKSVHFIDNFLRKFDSNLAHSLNYEPFGKTIDALFNKLREAYFID